jgi:hypothetical protein
VGGGGAGGAVRGPIGGPGAYVADGAAPGGQAGKVVFGVPGAATLAVQSIDAYLTSADQAGLFDLAQPIIDATRTTLCARLGAPGAPGVPLGPEYVIEVPVLLEASGGKAVTETADSVNMLVLRDGGGATRCLIPKPFGPVASGVYVFQEYLQRRLGALPIAQMAFANDWDDFHRHEGEIHCGTNQVPALLPANRGWWLHQPGQAP